MLPLKTVICTNCNIEFSIKPSNYNQRVTRNKNKSTFCSQKCWFEHRYANGNTTVNCATCNKSIKTSKAQIRQSKSGLRFCSHTCAAKYSNTHKTTGTRRSKLESYLESQLRSEFPNLELICNGKDAIGSELDFYFPQLRLAIELNGILHYEPIYGVDKLEQIQANDQQKSLRCTAAGIEFCTIDTSTVNNVTKSVKERYWSIVKILVAPLLGRADSTNMQVS